MLCSISISLFIVGVQSLCLYVCVCVYIYMCSCGGYVSFLELYRWLLFWAVISSHDIVPFSSHYFFYLVIGTLEFFVLSNRIVWLLSFSLDGFATFSLRVSERIFDLRLSKETVLTFNLKFRWCHSNFVSSFLPKAEMIGDSNYVLMLNVILGTQGGTCWHSFIGGRSFCCLAVYIQGMKSWLKSSTKSAD